MSLGLREKALQQRRKSGSTRTFMNWLNALPPDVKEEVEELLDDESIDGAAVYRALRQADIGFTFTDSIVGKWRRGEYEQAS